MQGSCRHTVTLICLRSTINNCYDVVASQWCTYIPVARNRSLSASLVPRPFFPIIECEGEGEKRRGIHCAGGSARALNFSIFYRILYRKLITSECERASYGVEYVLLGQHQR